VANEHDVQFYVTAPVSTFDFERMELEIELRDSDELRFMAGQQIAPLDVDILILIKPESSYFRGFPISGFSINFGLFS
jgi:methylthioribose-1-phosphate isomerase